MFLKLKGKDTIHQIDNTIKQDKNMNIQTLCKKKIDMSGNNYKMIKVDDVNFVYFCGDCEYEYKNRSRG